MRTLPIALLAATLLAAPALTPSPARAQQEHEAEKPKLYDESADGGAQIASALAKAKKENRRVLVQWGANWCGWCIQLHDHAKNDRELARKLRYEYDVVHIDIGKWDKHLDLAADLGADFQSNGVPYLTVLDAEGNVVTHQETGSLEAPDDPDHSHDSAKLMAFLTEHQADYLNASEVLQDGLARAETEGKLVFVHYGAPWCVWCHRLEDFMAREDIHAILDEHFIDIKIDIDRTIGGDDMLTEMRSTERGGIPWFAFVRSGDQGEIEIVAHSSESGNNIGFPVKEDEVAAFIEMLRKARPGIPYAQLKRIDAALSKAP